MRVQPQYYRVWQVEPCHRFGEVVRRSSRSIELLHFQVDDVLRTTCVHTFPRHLLSTSRNIFLKLSPKTSTKAFLDSWLSLTELPMLTDYFKVEEIDATANFEKLSEHHMQLTLISSLNSHITSWVNAKLTSNVPDIIRF